MPRGSTASTFVTRYDEGSDLDSSRQFVHGSMRQGKLATCQIGTARFVSPARPVKEDELAVERGIATQLSSNLGAGRVQGGNPDGVLA
jgi:hypothetical protein